MLCDSVCDNCNYYFGTKQKGTPSVEVVFKEILNLSRHIILLKTKEGKRLGRLPSEYFNFDKENYKISVNRRYRSDPTFQSKLARLFKRGLYKVYLEERQRVVGDALDNRFDFIREFARFDMNDFPVYYVVPAKGIMFTSHNDHTFQALRFPPFIHEMDKNYRIYEMHLYGHTFLLPLSSSFLQLYLQSYQKYYACQHWLIKGEGAIPIDKIEDIDFAHERRFDTSDN